ncbi:MAG: indole-3-glycerol phosphate synthase TrpC [Myxococcales bacterium]|nr:indole-3-glycerol phosphate synthase TrpC [Myxococcales bacterium]
MSGGGRAGDRPGHPGGLGVLGTILDAKREEVAAARAARSLAEVEAAARLVPPARSLAAALARPAGAAPLPVRVLAEVKRASPSAGPIAPGADPVAVARAYQEAGAAAISMLTDRRFFDGDLAFLAAARAAVTVPLLRKDFLVDAYQVVEARAAGADAVLLIVAALDDGRLAELLAVAAAFGMDALVEVHDEAEAGRAVAAGARLIGVNHRDLRTFELDLGLTGRLAPTLPAGTVLVAESGIRTPADVAGLAAAGAHAILVGETLMRAPRPGDELRRLAAGA